MKKTVYVIISLLVIVLSFSSLTACSTQDKNLKFDDKGNFRILQLTDIQLAKNGFTDDTKQMLTSIITNANADFIVLTGDQTSTELFYGNESRLLEITNDLVTFIDSFKTPWSMVFGNHDTMNVTKKLAIDKYDLMDIYTKATYFYGGLENTDYYKVFIDADNKETITNYSIPILKQNGEIGYNMILLDTISSFTNYPSVTENQIDFYQEESERLQGIPFVLFTHQAPHFFVELFEDGDLAIESTGAFAEGLASDTVDYESFYNSLKETNNVKGIFVGHDHLNDYAATADFDGFKCLFAYGRYSSYAEFAYKGMTDSFYRGGRIIDVNENGGISTFVALAKPLNETKTSFEYQPQQVLSID